MKINSFQTFEKHNKKDIKQREEQLKIGTIVEKEHDKTYENIKKYYKENNDFPNKTLVFKWIAEDHLDEFKDYYTRLTKMEKEAESDLN
jgi:hypothetical protein